MSQRGVLWGRQDPRGGEGIEYQGITLLTLLSKLEMAIRINR